MMAEDRWLDQVNYNFFFCCLLLLFVDVQRNDRDNQDQDIAIELFDDVEDDMGDDEDHDQDQDNEEGEEL